MRRHVALKYNEITFLQINVLYTEDVNLEKLKLLERAIYSRQLNIQVAK
jgi:hypothetical protein